MRLKICAFRLTMHLNVGKLRTRVAEDLAKSGLQRSIQLVLCIPFANCDKN